MLKQGDLFLRPVAYEDEKLVTNWYANPELKANHRQHLPFTQTQALGWVTQVMDTKDSAPFMIVYQSNMGKVATIGTCGLFCIHAKDHHAEIGIEICELEFRHKGVGTQVVKMLMEYGFNELNLHRLYSSVISHNQAGLGLFYKLGFVVEGRLRQHYFSGGRYHAEVLFGMLREEWLAGQRQSPLTESG